MNEQVENLLEARWQEIRRQIPQQWAKLTAQEVDEVEGEIERLVDLVGARYGFSARQARQEVERFLDTYEETARLMQQVPERMKELSRSAPWAPFLLGLLLAAGIVWWLRNNGARRG